MSWAILCQEFWNHAARIFRISNEVDGLYMESLLLGQVREHRPDADVSRAGQSHLYFSSQFSGL